MNLKVLLEDYEKTLEEHLQVSTEANTEGTVEAQESQNVEPKQEAVANASILSFKINSFIKKHHTKGYFFFLLFFFSFRKESYGRK